MLLKLLNFLTDSVNKNKFQVFMFHKIAKVAKKLQKLNNFNCLVNNINSEQNLGLGWVLQLLYNIKGWFPVMFYSVI